jgi:hypothetical protein
MRPGNVGGIGLGVVALALALSSACSSETDPSDQDMAQVIEAFCDAVCNCDPEDCNELTHRDCINFETNLAELGRQNGCVDELHALLSCKVEQAGCVNNQVDELACPAEHDAYERC